ncbi:ATP-binding protein [Pseudoalteromonas sp. K222D]|uniref:ATP-binding protein n=1 Tax=unclassified Pseudoalteromonas TaxID=194690 RepID=UPI001AD77675|nr:ATP-binding protein [Pseudoalteromonas sp. K222D]MBO7928071.1 ATP-binding protein [Pseudoalteromonas sp. K222D]
MLNPLTEFLPNIETRCEFHEAVRKTRSEQPPNHCHISSQVKELFYIPTEDAWKVYKSIETMIKEGYRNKNINSSEYFKEVNESIFSDINRPVSHITKKVELGGCLFGESGVGKTKLVSESLREFPQKITHQSLCTATNTPLIQIPWIMITCEATRKATLRLIIEEIDRVAGTRNLADLNERDSIHKHCSVIRLLCIQYSVGIIILDESQWFDQKSQSNRDSISSSFLQQIYNRFNVPILLIGTPQLVQALMLSQATLRRFKEAIYHELRYFEVDSQEWKTAIKTLFGDFIFKKSQKQLTDKQLDLIDDFAFGCMNELIHLACKVSELAEEGNINQLTEVLLKSSIKELNNGNTDFKLGLNNVPRVKANSNQSNEVCKKSKRDKRVKNKEAEFKPIDISDFI